MLALLLLVSNLVLASEDVVLLNRMNHEAPERQFLCIDDELMRHEKISMKVKTLDYLGAFDRNFCTDLNNDRTGLKHKLYEEVVKVRPAINVQASSRPNGRYDVYMVATETGFQQLNDRETEAEFLELSLDRKDYLKIGSVVLGSIVVGNYASNSFYENQLDKREHAIYGGAIAAGATGASLAAAFLIPDSRLSPAMKKLLVGCSGFIASALAGVAKEVLDTRDRRRHTVDKHDAFATALGGGAGAGCAYTWTF